MTAGLMRTLRATGAAAAYSAIVAPAGAVVLMYHSVAGPEAAPWIDPANRVSPEAFESHMEFLASRRIVVSMDDVADAARGRLLLPPGSVAITFDDGYLDNLTIAAPILQRLKVPATLYLPTAYIDTAAAQWIDRLYTSFTRRTGQPRAVPGPYGSIDVSTDAAAHKAYGVLREAATVADLETRERLLRAVEDVLSPEGTMPRLTMTWEDVLRLQRDFPLFSLGGHTVTHRDMTRCSGQEAWEEIAGCLSRLEARTGERPRHFSFPYGRADEAAIHAACSAGLASAVASGALPRARAGSNPWRISRIAAPSELADLAALTDPAYPDLPLTLLGRL